MKELLQTTSDFKIIPNNFKSSGCFKILEINNTEIKAELTLADKKELEDYNPQEGVEVFGVNKVGLVYFETKILSRENNIITLAATNDYSLIQRREYSRVGLTQGKVTFKDFAPDVVLKVEDISAGGIKIICTQPLELEKNYAVEISLSNNMKIECELQPIRINESNFEDKNAFCVSGKFVNLENVDRIVLVQYAFKIKMEEQNKEN